MANHGTIQVAEDEGSVLLLAPLVENSGLIYAPGGAVSLIGVRPWEGARPAGVPDTDVEVDGSRVYYTAAGDGNGGTRVYPGTVNQYGSGQILADRGTVGLYGKAVNQDGLIRAVSASRDDTGSIRLSASEQIVTGAGSTLASTLDAGVDTEGEIDAYEGGEVALTGISVKVYDADGNSEKKTLLPWTIDHRGLIEVDGGSVFLEAPGGGVALNGEVTGRAVGSVNSAISLYTDTIGDVLGLHRQLLDAGFAEQTLHMGGGDILIGSGQTLAAGGLTLWTDTGRVVNRGTIVTDAGGEIFLIGGAGADNYGMLVSPFGQVGLVAGTDVSIAHGSSRQYKEIGIRGAGGLATNHAGGHHGGDGGMAGSTDGTWFKTAWSSP